MDAEQRPVSEAHGSERRAAEAIRAQLGHARPQVALVLGSGLGQLADAVADQVRIPYSSITGFPAPTVAGHAGMLVAGRLEGVDVVLQSGRFHLYEGVAPDTAIFPVRVFGALGIRTLVVTNAAGALRPSAKVPGLMVIVDHINLMWRNPLAGPVAAGEGRFPDMSSPYDPELRQLAGDVARAHGVSLDQGVYAGVLGPSYETPAEIDMLRRIGADAVGMSTVPEVIGARARGIRVLGISTLSNYASGIGDGPLSHDEVLAAGRVVRRDLETVMRGLLPHLVDDA